MAEPLVYTVLVVLLSPLVGFCTGRSATQIIRKNESLLLT